MGTKTPNYQLNQWEPEDSFLRTDFNEDNAKIETALTELETQISAKCEVVFGTYTGDGKATRNIDLGFAPKAVILDTAQGFRSNTSASSGYGGIALQGNPIHTKSLVLTDTGFTLTMNSNTYLSNVSNQKYHYIAFK